MNGMSVFWPYLRAGCPHQRWFQASVQCPDTLGAHNLHSGQQSRGKEYNPPSPGRRKKTGTFSSRHSCISSVMPFRRRSFADIDS